MSNPKYVTSVGFDHFWSNLSTNFLNTYALKSDLYVHPKSGISVGTYKSVTVDVNGHVIAGTNPTTLDEYGITKVDADKITGVISLDNLPTGALERCVVVLDESARLALTNEQVQSGDTVKEESTGFMYFVVDDTKLGTDTPEEAFEIYTAGTASTVPWSGITDKPTEFTPTTHTHKAVDITDMPTSMVSPFSLTIQVNGVIKGVYNGASEVSINITPEDLGLRAMTETELDKMMGISA